MAKNGTPARNSIKGTCLTRLSGDRRMTGSTAGNPILPRSEPLRMKLTSRKSSAIASKTTNTSSAVRASPNSSSVQRVRIHSDQVVRSAISMSCRGGTLIYPPIVIERITAPAVRMGQRALVRRPRMTSLLDSTAASSADESGLPLRP